ncbi:ATP-binding protein [Streptomyces sp. CB01580]|uniref:ATP-binding protein n=1 Tax=Streptomyces sp. CB01580 TaxID=1703933 RepID=UPI001F5B4E86|nr:ATP-binding protein [Streptomyces sp. CB01580]
MTAEPFESFESFEPFALELIAVPKAVPQVRQILRDWCGQVDALHLLLCVSELLANVIVHLGEGTPVGLRVTGTDCGHVRVELSDPEPGVWPTPRAAGIEDESGRGLALVGALASRWGVEQGVRGKTVWCELPAPDGWGQPEGEPAAPGGRTEAGAVPGAG